MDEGLCNLTLQESQGTVEFVVGDMPKRREGSDEERDGDTEKKREIEEGEEGIDSEIEKTDNEERVENSNDDTEKKGSEEIEKRIDGDNDDVETEKKEELIDGKNDNIITETDSDSEKKTSGEEKQGSTDSEEKVGDREEMIDCVNKHDEIEEKIMVRSGSSKKKEIDEETIEDKVMLGDSGCEKKEIGEKEENMNGCSEDKGEEGEEKEGGENNLKAPVKVLIPYPQRPFTKDCPTYLKTGYCPFGMVCCFNHPLRKSSTISPNGDCKERERDGDQEKKELVGRANLSYAQPYPQREGKEDCTFYLKTGRCGYGTSCCFNHPPQNLNPVNSILVAGDINHTNLV